eukprot:948528-Prymnesium_polylepis.2
MQRGRTMPRRGSLCVGAVQRSRGTSAMPATWRTRPGSAATERSCSPCRSPKTMLSTRRRPAQPPPHRAGAQRAARGLLGLGAARWG